MYGIKKFLSSPNFPSTSSIVCYKGPPNWTHESNPDYEDKFVEISDCHSKIRLHQTDIETDADFIRKLKRLEHELKTFIEYLEGGQNDTSGV